MTIHATALVDSGAQLGTNVEVGPFCVVGSGVSLDSGCRLVARVTISGPVTAGSNNVFHPNVVIGGEPQDRQSAAADARIKIGDRNVFREGSTVNLPKVSGGVTQIGSRNRFHFASHVGHDSIVGNDVILCTDAVLGGHTMVEDGACVEGLGGTHQFVTVGRSSWSRTHIPITEDVPPYMWVDGNHFKVMGVNPPFHSEALEQAYETIWCSGLPRPEALATLEDETSQEVRELVAFLRRSASGRMNRWREGERG